MNLVSEFSKEYNRRIRLVEVKNTYERAYNSVKNAKVKQKLYKKIIKKRKEITALSSGLHNYIKISKQKGTWDLEKEKYYL